MSVVDLSRIKLITFDCYGTLIDWNEGLTRSLRAFTNHANLRLPDLMEAYIRIEATLEQQSYRSYAEIQRLALARLGERFNFSIRPDAQDALSTGIASWPPFSDTVESLQRLKSKTMLGVLSNIDIGLFADSARRLRVPFDLVITAEDVQSYKPSHGHFLRMLQQTGLQRENILHVAQSLYHDAAPAAALGLPFVWINRYGQATPADAPMLAEFSSLAKLTDMLLNNPA